MNEEMPQTFTAEHRSWEWELVLQYEDGSLPASAWHEATLQVVAGWYAKTLAPELARKRYSENYQRNRRRLSNRLSSGNVNNESLEALDAIWEGLLESRLAK